MNIQQYKPLVKEEIDLILEEIKVFSNHFIDESNEHRFVLSVPPKQQAKEILRLILQFYLNIILK